MTTEIFDMFKIITLKQQKFSQSDPDLVRQISKNCSPIQSWSGQNWLQSWSSPIQSCPCSSLQATYYWCWPLCFPSANFAKRKFPALMEHNIMLDHKWNESAVAGVGRLNFLVVINLWLLKLRKQKLSLQHLYINYLRETVKRHWRSSIELFVFCCRYKFCIYLLYF